MYRGWREKEKKFRRRSSTSTLKRDFGAYDALKIFCHQKLSVMVSSLYLYHGYCSVSSSYCTLYYYSTIINNTYTAEYTAVYSTVHSIQYTALLASSDTVCVLTFLCHTHTHTAAAHTQCREREKERQYWFSQ